MNAPCQLATEARQIPRVLLDLVDLGHDVVRYPGRFAPDEISRRYRIAADLEQRFPMQARFFTAARCLIVALDQLTFHRRAGDPQASAWEAVCGGLGAIVRLQAANAIEWQREHLGT